MLGLACEQFALFVGPTGDGQPAGRGLRERGAANLAHLFKKDVLDGLALDYFADGAKKLVERFVVDDGGREERADEEEDEEETSKRPPTDHRWIVVPLPSEDTTVETGSEDILGSEESPLPSPILTMEAEEDPLLSFDLMEEEEGGGGLGAACANAHEPGFHGSEDADSSLLDWIPDVFAKRDNIATVLFADSDAAASEHAKPSIFLGTRSNELVTIRDGSAVACLKLPFTPLTMYVPLG
jgi:hypothetical protein